MVAVEARATALAVRAAALCSLLVAMMVAIVGPAPAGAESPAQEVRAFGAAPALGSPGSVYPLVGLAPTPDGQGYWLAAADGGVFTHGSARFYGSAGGIRLAQAVVDLAALPTGDGYWLAGLDGGVLTYGAAPFLGSLGGVELNEPIVGMAATPSGGGYWLVASDGGVFTFGDAGFFGSAGAAQLARPVSGMAATSSGQGYWLVDEGGVVRPFGDATLHGQQAPPAGRAVGGVATHPSGDGYWTFDTLHGVAAPPLPPGSGSGRRIVYSNSRQRVWLVEAGEVVVQSHLVSGRRGVPRSGTYRVFSKSRHSRSANGSVTMEYMVRFARGSSLAIGFHSIPTYPNGRTIQSEQELGSYRSAGCVRQRLADAARLWDFAPVGTVVVVTP